MTELSRRRALQGLGLTSLAIPTLAACGGDSGTGTATEGGTGGSSGASGGAEGGGSGGVLARTSDIPEGGGTIFGDQSVVVTQPEKGTFKCFSSVCTHQGCPVTSVAEGTIDCSCHGSKFSISDGSVQEGPAEEPLPEEKITVKGDSITLG